MDATKIRLSPEELALVKDAQVILTKNAIMQKMYGLLGSLQELNIETIRSHKGLPAEVKKTGAKISKGENYLGLPYLVLDQPRYFEIGHLFAIRTMFWWGRYFSITLHLSGRHLHSWAPLLADHYEAFASAGYLFYQPEDPWKHHLEEDNYLPLTSMTRDEFTRRLNERPFIKLAKKIPLGNIDDAIKNLQAAYTSLLRFLETK
jgi:hypothetical protein